MEHRRLKLFEFKLQSQYFSFSIYFERASRSLNMKLCGTYLKWWGVAENVQNFECLPRTHLSKRSNKIGISDKVAIFIPPAEIAQSIWKANVIEKSF